MTVRSARRSPMASSRGAQKPVGSVSSKTVPVTTLFQQQTARRARAPAPLRRFNPETPPVRQTGPWQCSAASTAWLLQSLGFTHSQDDVVRLLQAMTPPAITDQFGLSNGDGSALVRLLSNLGLQAHNAWLS